MAYNYDYPYVDVGRQNADWMLKTVSDLDAKVNNLLDGGIESALDEYFNSIMIDAIYDPITETITLKKELVVGDGDHIYNAGDNSMTIE